MRVCGVELKDNYANICILALDNDVFDIPDCRQHKLVVDNCNDGEQLRRFQFAFAKLMEDYQVDRVVVQQRMAKGKFAAHGSTFKLEAALQLHADLQVSLLAPQAIKDHLKRSPLPVEFKHTGLKPFQEQAFITAFTFLDRK